MKKIYLFIVFWAVTITANAQTLAVSMQTEKVTGESIEIKVAGGGTGNFYIDWGDGDGKIEISISNNVNSPTVLTKTLSTNQPVIQLFVEGTYYTFITTVNNGLTSLDVTKTSTIRYLRCYNNKLNTLDVSTNKNLVLLHCYGNLLTELNVSENYALTDLQLHNNQITSIDLYGLTALRTLVTTNNLLGSIDVSTNSDLQTLNVRNSKLTSLDLTNNINLIKVDIFNSTNASHESANHFDACALDALYQTLPKKTTAANLLVSNNLYNTEGDAPDNDAAGSNKTIATGKGWTVKSYQDDILTGDGGGCTTGFFRPNSKPHLEIYPNPAVDFINIRYSDQLSEHRVLITDLVGKVCLDKNLLGQDVTLELKSLTKGIYLIYTAESVRKVVIE